MKVIHRAGDVVVRGLNACGEWEVVGPDRSIYYTDDRQDAIATADDIERRVAAQANAADTAHEASLEERADRFFEESDAVSEKAAKEIAHQTRKVEAKRRARSFLRTSARFMRVKER